MQNIRTLYDEALQNCHSERSEESNAETLRCARGDNQTIRIDTRLASVFDFSRESVDRLIDLGDQDAQASYADAADLYERMMEMHRRGDRIQVLADSLPNRKDPGV